jgi:hypothetical protein
MAKNILYSIATTSTGKLVNAVDAKKEEDYACPFCSQPFILRKGTRKRPHFAHKNLSHNCTPETALHYSFKTLLSNKIQEHIYTKRPLEIRWKCSNCYEWHTGNLLKKAVQVKTEYDLGSCRPDIVLLDRQDKAIAVIEVIVTHSPEQKVLDYYKSNRIAVVSYFLKSDEDINRLDSSILVPDSVDLCTNPKCSECGNYMAKKKLLVIDGKCSLCSAPMKVAAIDKSEAYLGWGSFSQSDIPLAAQHGCFLKSHYSRTAGERYIANTCRKCGAFIGQHYLFTEYVAAYCYSEEEFDIGFYCPSCSSEYD